MGALHQHELPRRAPVSTMTPGGLPSKVLVVDDDDHFRDYVADVLTSHGCLVDEGTRCDEGLDRLQTFQPDLALFDLRLPVRGGLWLLRSALKVRPGLRAVMVSGYSSVATAVDAVRMGAVDYLAKPTSADDLLRVCRGASEPEVDRRIDPSEWMAPSLARLEWEHINRVLAECDGNISQAARILRIHRQSLQRKLRKYPPAR